MNTATIQLVNPGYIPWWVTARTKVADWIGFTGHSWMSPSILSFAVAAIVTLAVRFPPAYFPNDPW